MGPPSDLPGVGRTRNPARSGWTVLAALLAVAILPGGQLLRADVHPLSLYQKTARAALVVRARATSDSTRRPPMDVLEIYKGVYPGKTLFVVPFFQDYANPKPWLKREVFQKGEEYVLFLNPFEEAPDAAFPPSAERGSADKPTHPDDESPEKLFVVLNADQGVTTIPAEGATALTDAVKRFVAILSLGQHDLQAEALRGLLTERNPFLLEAGLGEVERFDLADPDDASVLLGLLASPREEFRAGSLRIIAQLGRSARTSGREMRDRPEIFSRLVERAYGDSAAPVRRDAVRALAGLGGEGVEAVLRAVGERDPDQDVRYQAEVEILAAAGSARPREKRP
jgi:hypothetical protein